MPTDLFTITLILRPDFNSRLSSCLSSYFQCGICSGRSWTKSRCKASLFYGKSWNVFPLCSLGRRRALLPSAMSLATSLNCYSPVCPYSILHYWPSLQHIQGKVTVGSTGIKGSWEYRIYLISMDMLTEVCPVNLKSSTGYLHNN